MKLEDQICCLEYAKRLKELGVKQESLLVWAYSTVTMSHDIEFYNNESPYGNSYSAYTVAELLDLLPESLPESAESVILQKVNVYPNNIVTYFCEYRYGLAETEAPQNAANCLAAMLIYLIENKLLDINDL